MLRMGESMVITSVAVMAGICVTILICLAFQLGMTAWAARKPYFENPRREQMPAGVRGGRHVAVGGRSVAPSRYALAIPVPEAEQIAGQVAEQQAAGASWTHTPPAPRVPADAGFPAAARQDAPVVPVPRPTQADRPSKIER
jgi:hypothetical protein